MRIKSIGSIVSNSGMHYVMFCILTLQKARENTYLFWLMYHHISQENKKKDCENVNTWL